MLKLCLIDAVAKCLKMTIHLLAVNNWIGIFVIVAMQKIAVWGSVWLLLCLNHQCVEVIIYPSEYCSLIMAAAISRRLSGRKSRTMYNLFLVKMEWGSKRPSENERYSLLKQNYICVGLSLSFSQWRQGTQCLFRIQRK